MQKPVKEEVLVKVAATSDVKKLAYAIFGFLKGDAQNPPKDVIITAVGAGAVSQATKSMAIARQKVAGYGYDLIVRPGFTTGDVCGEEKTIMKFIVTMQ